MAKTTIDISTRSLWRIAGFLVAFWAILKLRNIIFYLLFALLFAVALAPMVNWFQKRGLKRGSALAIVLVMVVGIVFFFIGMIAVNLISTVTQFVNDLPVYAESFRQYEFLEPYIDDVIEAVEDIEFSDVVQQGLNTSGTIISSASKVVEATLFTFFFTVYMLLESNYLRRIIKKVYPKNWPKYSDMEREFVEVVGGYIRGQLLTSFLVGLSSYIFFRILGVPNAAALAIIAGITDIIPVIGGLIGIIPAALVALTVSPLTSVTVILLMQTYSTISNYFIRPKIFGASLSLSPFIVAVATTAGLYLFGIPGIIMALPFAAIIGFVFTKYHNIPILEEDTKDK